MKLRASDLRHRITITKRVKGAVVAGVRQYTETAYYIWAEVSTLRGRELEAAMQKWGEAQFKIRVRYARGLNIGPEDRITYDSRALDILGSEDPDGQRWEVWIYAKETK